LAEQTYRFEDRKAFTTETLANGMQLHFRPQPRAPKQRIRVIIPLGHLHNHHFANGATHFFEHVTLSRSEAYREEPGGLHKQLEFEGGDLNARTDSRTMTFEADIPFANLGERQKEFVRQIFYPILLEEDISIDRGAIRAEKWGRGKYYPYISKEAYRLYTEWVTEVPRLTPEWAFGSDEEIQSMTIEMLQEVQSYFFSPANHIVVTGGTEEDIHSLREELSRLPTYSHMDLKHQHVTLKWANDPLTELPSSSDTLHCLLWGGILPQESTPELETTFDFLCDILGRKRESVLFREYREKQKILYTPEVGFKIEDEGIFCWGILSFADVYHVERVSQELEEVIFRYLNDSQYLKRLGEKQLNNFRVNTCEDYEAQVNAAKADVQDFGRVISMTEELETMQTLIDDPQKHLLPLLENMETRTLHVKPEED